MKLKQKKFVNVLSLTDILSNQIDSIYLISHVSDLNTTQKNLLKIYCDKNDIISIQPKLNLLKKITKNELFLNLYSGPTKMFLFKDPLTFLTFLKNSPIDKKIIPLAVYFNSEFYSYPKFFDILNNLNQSISIKNNSLQLNLISNLNNNSINLLKSLKITTNNFINFLSYIKSNKKT